MSGRAASSDPLRLLRHPGPIEPYPLEPSDAELAASAGLRPDQIVRYDMNTLGGGPLPGARAALERLDHAVVVPYGDLGYRELRAALGRAAGVEPRRIVPGAGADELIRLLTHAVAWPGDAVVVATPTFPMFAVEAGLAGARVVTCPREDPARRQPAAALRDLAEREAARLVWVCSPNNPTGDAHPLDALRQLATGLEAIVAVDQVYLEFAVASGATDLDAVTLQDELDNVVVLRSLSKAYGMAGARIGYLVVPDGLTERFDALRLPLPVAGPSEALALGALEDLEAARERHASIVRERERLATTLRHLGCEALDSVTNFVTFRPPDAATLAASLLRRGIVVREFAAEGPMGGWLRATALDSAANERLIGALGEELG